MKLALILMFLSYWIYVKANDNFKVCRQLSFIEDTDEVLRNKYKNEYSFTYNVKKNLHNFFARKNVIPSFKIEGKLAKFFCVCAFYNFQQLINVENSEMDEDHLKESFDEINKKTTSDKESLGIYIWPYSMFFLYEHHFPATYCVTDGKEYLVAKGPDKKSDENQSYNIYAAIITEWFEEDPIYNMEGYFQDVALKKLDEVL